MPENSPAMAIVAQLIAGWQALDSDAVAACFTPDGVWHNMPYAPIAGRVAVGAAAAKFLAGVTECRFEVRYAGEIIPGVVMNERVDIFRRTDGQALRFAVAGVFEIEDGLIRVWRDYFDSALMNG